MFIVFFSGLYKIISAKRHVTFSLKELIIGLKVIVILSLFIFYCNHMYNPDIPDEHAPEAKPQGKPFSTTILNRGGDGVSDVEVVHSVLYNTTNLG